MTHRTITRRRGSVYLLVLGMTMLVGVAGAGALLAARAQFRGGRAGNDFAAARLCARAGLEVAMFKVRTDPTWRTDLGNGAWLTNVPLGQGSYSVSAADPVTGDVTLATNHPVVLTCTGKSGAAVYKLQTTVLVTPGVNGCLGVNACSAGDTNLAGPTTTLTSNQLVAANGNINNTGSAINANVEAVGKFAGGGTYSGLQTTLAQAIAMPDASHVFDYYKANGTTIAYTALYQSNKTEIDPNPTIETDASGWYVYTPGSGSPAIAQSSAQHRSGTYSLLCSSRTGTGQVPAIDLPLPSIRNGDTYALSVAVYARTSAATTSATLVLQASGGTQTFSTTGFHLGKGSWVVIKGNVVASWTGTLAKATLTLTTDEGSQDLYVDDASVTDTSLPGSAYVMDRVVLSPASNPYGTTNPQGIYVIDCSNQNVTIGPCRIVGTVVLLNYGSNTAVQGPITWEPAVAGYPALLADSKIAVNFDASVALSESTYGINFNPASTPYPYSTGTANTSAADAFPSLINGIVYAGNDITFSGAPAVTGNVVSAGKLIVNSTSLSLQYSNASYVSPPPGFTSQLPTLTPQPGSWQRVTN